MTLGTYAGIGSRDTPADVLQDMFNAAAYLASINFTLRSGAADGADTAFEMGCDSQNGPKEIFLPWPGFNGSKEVCIPIPNAAFEIAAKYHPNWGRLRQPVRNLMARNALQILGPNLNQPADFVLCWTPMGSGSGGTGQAIRHARAIGVPVFDMGGQSASEIEAGVGEIIQRKLDQARA